MTAIESMKAASSSLLFGSQGVYNTRKAQTSEDSKSGVITSGNNGASVAAGSGISTVNPSSQIATKSNENTKVNATGLNMSFLGSKLFAGNTVGVNNNIAVGSSQFTAGQVGKNDGISRTLCIA